MRLSKFFGLDKASNLRRAVKQHGGIMGSIAQMFRTDDLRYGELVGVDQFGNRYFENNEYFMPRNRWVDYNKKVWLDYDASQVPPEWHGWLHHSTDTPPTVQPPTRHAWQMPYKQLMTGTAEEYVPYSTTRTKIQAWQPRSPKPAA